jgi:Spy/CpxP family protein refolding chaperone
MKLLTLAISTAILASFSALSFAQGPAGGFNPTPEQKKQMEAATKKSIDDLGKELKLNDKQKKQMLDVQKDIQAKIMKIMQGTGDQSAKMKAGMALQTEAIAKIKKILNKEQYAKLEAKMKSRMGSPGPR